MKFMNNILITILTMMSCVDGVKEDFVSVCRMSSDKVKLEYLDSANAIESIEQQTSQDTLVLIVRISPTVKNESKIIEIPKGTNSLKIGSRLFSLNNLQQCSDVRTGKDALEHLEKMK